MTKRTVTFRTELTSIPSLKTGDIVRVYDCICKVMAKRDYPATVEGVTEGADGPCSQVDLKLIHAEDDTAERTFKFLATGNKGLAMLQGNHLYEITRLHKESIRPA